MPSRRDLFRSVVAAFQPDLPYPPSSQQRHSAAFADVQRDSDLGSRCRNLTLTVRSWDGWTSPQLGIALALFWPIVILMLPEATSGSLEHRGGPDALGPAWGWVLLLGSGAFLGVWGAATVRPVLRHLFCAALGLLQTLLALCAVLSDPAAVDGSICSTLALLALLNPVAGR